MEPLHVITQEQSWRQEVSTDVVATLERVLERAKAGEFTGIAIAATCKDDCTYTTFSKRERSGLMLGAVSRLQFNLQMSD